MKLRKLVSFTAIAAMLGVSLLAPTSTFADDSICDNPHISDETKAASGCTNVESVGDLPSVIQNILNAVILVAGIISVIYIIIGGINYMTSSGDAAKTQKAKNTILYALIGLIICALSFAIVNWTITAIKNSNVANTDSHVQTDLAFFKK